MIRLTDRWSVTREKHHWILIEHYMEMDAEKNEVPRGSNSYHPYLNVALRHAAEQDCEGANCLADIARRYQAIEVAFETSVGSPHRDRHEIHAQLVDSENECKALRQELKLVEKEY